MLGAAAALEIPSLIVIGKLGSRFPSITLIATGCLSGIIYYIAASFVTSPVWLIVLQPLNAWRVAAISGMGLTLFQRIIPRAGLSTGLFTNTTRLGAICSGPIIALGSATALGERGIFLTCGCLSLLSLVVILIVARLRPDAPDATSLDGDAQQP